MVDENKAKGYGGCLFIIFAICFFLFLYKGGIPVLDHFTILGGWANEKGEWCITFNGDGMYEACGIFSNVKGKYEILDKRKLKLAAPGMLWGESCQEVEYELEVNKLTINLGHILGQELKGTFTRK